MTSHAHHTDVGAYALGALDPADAERFEEHLADCPSCARELEELLGLRSVLAEFAQDAPATGDHGDGLNARPAPGMLDRLLGEAAAERRRRGRRRLALVAAALALVVAGPLAGAAWTTGQDADRARPGAAAEAVYAEGDKRSATDPATSVAATVATVPRAWGTEVAVRLSGVSGPRTCGLVAVGKDGTEQTVTTWTVPATGYAPREQRYYLGGAAYDRSDIDHFEVRTLDGTHLVTVPG
ncbi:anti-sigma factor [Streptomyces sp. JJ38]|uniref:anti-sigma factor family protein n=1 Tax=Streptomyces sp. JJ38 TaxID=2738128 RepID=UPI001C5A02F9|nr:zf-HC2 domain-containing protein [Streptomyces sp. JJ38]MBW1598550.1 zf-HC2 domain-containing protein [Streptomyces sp. JJ38]